MPTLAAQLLDVTHRRRLDCRRGGGIPCFRAAGFVASEVLASGGGGFPAPPIPIDPDNFGADLWRFPSADEPAILKSQHGFGNFLNYGGRVLLADDAYLYIGSANAMNLRAGADDEFKGGWELLKFLPRERTRHGFTRNTRRYAPAPSGAERRRIVDLPAPLRD
jgi:hypothetical protein